MTGRTACEAYDLALYGDGHDPDVWATRGERERAAWKAAARASTVTAWRLLDEARAEVNRVTAERDALSAKLADNAAELPRIHDGCKAVIAGLEADRDQARAALAASVRFTPFQTADDAIGLFLEYRDKHGHDEASARTAAALEVAEGAAVTDAELAGDDPPVIMGAGTGHIMADGA